MRRVPRALALLCLALALAAPGAARAGEVKTITIGVTLVGTFSGTSGESSTYYFGAWAGQQIRIRVGGHAGFIPRAAITGPTGVLWSGAPSQGTAVTSPWLRIPQDGQYAIIISAVINGQAGAYTLSTTSDVFQMTEQPQGEYHLGSEQRGWLPSPLHVHSYIFNVPFPGYLANVSGRGGEGLSPRMIIRDPGGNVIYDNQAGPNGSFGPDALTFTRTGGHGVAILATDDTSGVYAFSIAPQSSSPGAPPPASGTNQQIYIDFPQNGATMAMQIQFRGRTTAYPFEGQLHWRVLDETGAELSHDVFPVVGSPGGPTSWSTIVARPQVGTGRRLTVQIYDFDGAVTGQVIALASVTLIANDG